MGFLERMGLVEEVPTENAEYNVDYDVDYEDAVDAELSQVNTDTLIEDVYSENNLSDKSKSIFKVEELIASLPKEMPTEAKKNTVSSALAVFGMTSVEVTEDGEKRMATLSTILNQIETNATDEINYKEGSIEEHKKEISRLEKEISDKQDEVKKSKETINTEIDKIDKLIKFIGGTK